MPFKILSSLQKTVDETPSHDVHLLMGNLIGKIGRDNRGKESMMGQQGLGEGNNNGGLKQLSDRWYPLYAQESPQNNLELSR